MTAEHYYAALRNSDYARAYQYLDTDLVTSFSREQFISMARQRDEEEGSVSSYTYASDLNVTTIPLVGEPLPLVTFTRTHAPSYPVHLQVHQVGKTWKISAFDRI